MKFLLMKTERKIIKYTLFHAYAHDYNEGFDNFEEKLESKNMTHIKSRVIKTIIL